MKYDNHDGSTVETNLSGRSTQMGIDPNSIAHLINVVTDIYADPAAAVIREVSTNGRDAQDEIGNTDPIKVYLPSEFSPVFEVVDKGVGMTEDQIHNEFGQYGFSSKRDSNDVVGMLGLGCKAPLTYTPQFTVVSVKDGVETRVVITRQANGVGKVVTADGWPKQVDEPNGTSVQVPVIDVDSFNAKAQKFFRYWTPGTVLVNGSQPDSIWEASDVLRLDDDVLLIPSNVHGGDDSVRVVMGNVAYPLDYSHSSTVTGPLAHGATVVARIPIGSVNITPNRDGLSYTAKTEDVVNMLATYVKEATLRRYNQRIADAPTAREAMQIAAEGRRVLWNYKPTWQGQVVPAHITVGRGNSWAARNAVASASFGMRVTSGNRIVDTTANDLSKQTHSIGEDDQVLVITGYGLSSVPSVNKAKVMLWAEAKGLTGIDRVLFRSHKGDSLCVWTDGDERFRYVAWDEVKKTDVPARYKPTPSYSSSGPSTAAPSDDLSEVRVVDPYGGDYAKRSREFVNGYERIVMIAPSDMTKSDREQLAKRLTLIDVPLVVVNKNRHDLAPDAFTAAIHTTEDVDDLIDQWVTEALNTIDLSFVGYFRQFDSSDLRGYAHRGPKRRMETLRNKVSKREVFQHHTLRAVEAIVARAAEEEKLRMAAVETLNAVERLTPHGQRPVKFHALRRAINEATSTGYYAVHDKTDLRALCDRLLDEYEEQFPLLTALSTQEQVHEYARLLTLDA